MAVSFALSLQPVASTSFDEAFSFVNHITSSCLVLYRVCHRVRMPNFLYALLVKAHVVVCSIVPTVGSTDPPLAFVCRDDTCR